MKDIVIIANFLSQLDGDGNSRFLYLANRLKQENQLEIISSSYSHTRKKKRNPKEIARNFDFKVTLIKECGYPKNVCLKRFYSHYQFGTNTLAYMKQRKRPDLVYCAIPSLSVANLVGGYCKKEGIPFLVDIQDLWPEAFQMVWNIPVVSSLIFSPFRYLADAAYKKADYIFGVSQTYVDRAKKVNPEVGSTVVYLGTDLDVFDQNAASVNVKKGDELWLGYCGTLGTSYDLPCVFDALSLLKKKGQTVPRFIIMGDGPKEDEFKAYARKLELNVMFTGLLPYPEMCAYLKACDMAVNPIVADGSQSITNKHADYVSAGLAVLNTQNCDEYRLLIEAYGMGINCNNHDARDLAKKLETMIDNPQMRQHMGLQARRCAEERFDRRNSYHQILRVIEKY